MASSSQAPLKRDIETVIDRLLDFVRSNGKVRLSDASKALALSPSQVEKLALLLEESGLLEVNYGLTEVTLKEKTFTPKEDTNTQAAKVAKRKFDAVIEKSKKLEFEVMTSENLLRFIEKDIEKRLYRAELLIKSLEESENFSVNELDAIEKELSLAFDQLSAFSTEIDSLKKKHDQFTRLLSHFKKRLHVHSKKSPVAQIKALSLLDKIKLILKQIASKIKTPTLPMLPMSKSEVKKQLKQDLQKETNPVKKTPLVKKLNRKKGK